MLEGTLVKDFSVANFIERGAKKDVVLMILSDRSMHD